MISPTLNSLLREIVLAPDDPLLRRVLADWLEETGNQANVAWANYIRLRLDARAQATEDERRLLRERAREYESRIMARLTLPASRLIGHAESFFDLLPFHRHTVRLDSFDPPQAIVRRVSIERLELCRAVPLTRLHDRILFAAEDPEDGLAGRIDPFLPLTSLFIRGIGIPAALSRCLDSDNAVVIQPFHDDEGLPSAGQPNEPHFVYDSPWQGIQQIIRECRDQNAGGFEILAAKEGQYAIRYLIRGRPTRRYVATTEAGRELVDAAKRLLWKPQAGYEVIERRSGFGRGAFVRLSRRAE